MNSLVPAFLIFILVLSPWLIHAGDFIFSKGFAYSDLTISHLPNAIYLLDSIKEFGKIPFWSNLILSGAPFAADPLAGIWYPLGWIAFFLPQPLGFNINAFLHMIWGAVGMVLLLRSLKIHSTVALTGGIAFLLMPKIFSHLAAGHITLVYAVSWTPWIFLAELKRKTNPSSGFIQKIAPGIVIGIIFLADPRWMAYSATAWLFYSLTIHRVIFTSRQFSVVIKYITHIVVQGISAAGIAAVLILPLVEFTGLSTRSALTSQEVLRFSLPPEQLLGFVLPNIGGFWEWQIYPGVMIVILVICAILNVEVRKRASFWLWLTLAVSVISLGSLWPGAEKLAELPGANLLRVPPRAWFLAGIGLIVTAAYYFDDLVLKQQKKIKPDPLVVILPLAFFAVLLTVGLAIMGHTPPIGFVWGACGLVIGVMLLVFVKKNNSRQIVFPFVVIFLIADLGGVNLLGMSFHRLEDVMNEGDPVVNLIANQESLFRVYSPSYTIPYQSTAAEGIQRADGINPLHLANYDEFLAAASGVPAIGYSVTVPRFATGSPLVDNRRASIDTRMMGLLNVEYIASSYELVNPRLTEVWQGGGGIVYKNQDFLPRAWIQPKDDEMGRGLIQKVGFDQVNQDKMQITGDGPGILVISVPDYPGWTAKVDGEDAEIFRIADLLMGIALNPGTHKIVIEFKPTIVYWGLIISTVSWIAILTMELISVRRRGKQIEIA